MALLFFFFIFGVSQKTTVLRIKKYQIAKLNDSLSETSGLDIFRGRLFTFNDSGNTSELFELNKNTGNIIKKYKTELRNIDWEALTNDGYNFYIGDFGNNAGTRKDLKIYKIPFSFLDFLNHQEMLIPDKEQKNRIKTISFYYPEQADFTPKNLNTDFDMEAMVFYNGKLHLFTKEWTSKKVSHYLLDSDIREIQPAIKVETFPIGFSVTDAAVFNQKLYLVGYTKNAKVYLMIFDEKEGLFFHSKYKKYKLGSAFFIGQIEGIAVDETGIYLSGEAFHSPLGVLRQRLYSIPNQVLRDEE